MDHELLDHAMLAVELATEYLREIGESDFTNATAEQRKLAKELGKLMTAARKQMTAANKAMNPGTRRSDSVEPEERPPEFKDDEFIHTLAAIIEDDYLLEDEFWELMLTKQPNHPAALTVALRLSVRGLHSYTMEKLNEVLGYIDPASLRAASTRMNWDPIDDLDDGDMLDTFKMLQNDVNPLEVITGAELAQHMTLSLRVLRWALQWRKLGESANPTLDKQAKVVEMWRLDTGDSRSLETVQKDPGFKHFQLEVADYRRGANRVLSAYETLGSSVLICPHFRWMAQKDSRIGNTFSHLIQRLANILEGTPNRVTIEAVFHDLAHDMAAAMDQASKSLVPGLAQVQSQANRKWMPAP